MPEIEFPTNALEFNDRFSTEEACATYLEKLRWPNGFACPKCGGAKVSRMKARPLLQCLAKECRHQTSLTAGTPLQGTRKPLRAWLQAMFLVATQKTGTSAANLQRQVGLGSYETAWAWLHKIRACLALPGRAKLAGRVEIDEGYVGGTEEGKPGRGAEDKAVVAVAAEDLGGHIGRVRLAVEPDASQESLTGFVVENVAKGSTAHTDGWSGYAKISKQGIAHEAESIKKSSKKGSELFPLVHLVLSLLKRWLLGTFQGAVSEKHLQAYLDEFTFRFNRRRCRRATGIFERLAQAVVTGCRTTYRAIVHGRAALVPACAVSE